MSPSCPNFDVPNSSRIARPFWLGLLLNDGIRRAVRNLLFVWTAIIVCPFRSVPLNEQYQALLLDHTWIFALNYAAARGLAVGRDFVWTTGPLGFLALPENIGNNLAYAFILHAFEWALLVAILWDLFSHSRLPLRNLALFSGFLALLAPGSTLYDPFLAGGLILLVHFRLRGGTWRYVTALLMIGVTPLFWTAAGMISAGVAVGVAADAVLNERARRIPRMLAALLLPALVAGVGYWLTLRSADRIVNFFRSSFELSRGYSFAMSTQGPQRDFLAAAETFAIIAIAVGLIAVRDRRLGIFFSFLLPLPLFAAFKHGFVRQDHLAYFFCFAAFALALITLALSLEGRAVVLTLCIVFSIFATLWQDYATHNNFKDTVAGATGLSVVPRIRDALKFGNRQRTISLHAQSSGLLLPLEPEIRAVLQNEPVASLSRIYHNNVLVDQVNLVLYPVLQRYSAYTPYLDELNAAWIRDKGPRFLLFDGTTIDGRHPWAETPAMWLEVYRWYQIRIVGTSNLLLERRNVPRFTDLQTISRTREPFADGVSIPDSSEPVFWRMQCPLTSAGKIRSVLLRIPEVTMRLSDRRDRGETFRVVVPVLSSPSLGNYLPSTLAEFAAIFSSDETPGFYVKRLTFGGPGLPYYGNCEVELLRPANWPQT